MKVTDVARAFANGRVAAASNLSSSGREAFSYQLKIAEAREDGTFAVLSRNASPSVTTSRHINAVRAELPARMVEEVQSF